MGLTAKQGLAEQMQRGQNRPITFLPLAQTWVRQSITTIPRWAIPPVVASDQLFGVKGA
jgi:hypothetical protein